MSSLQQQLSVIAANSVHQLDLKAQKKAHGKSLLFEPHVAVSQDFNTIFQICFEGFEELCKLDARFTVFAANLFSEQSKTEERGQMTPLENSNLDTVLERFLVLVSSRVLLKPALKALEWLVRRFRVHEDNTEFLLLTFLPYHQAPIFTTLLSILPRQIPKTFRFLQPYIGSLSNPPLEIIVYTASQTPAFFTSLSRYVLRVAKSRQHSSVLLSFWATIAAQSINNMLDNARAGQRNLQDQRQEKVFLLVLPILKDCLAAKGAPEMQLSCYMLLSIISSKSSMSEQLIASLMDEIVKSWTIYTIDGGLACLAVLAQDQQVAKLPKSVRKGILRLPDLGQYLHRLKSQYRADSLLFGLTLAILDSRNTPLSSEHLAIVGHLLVSHALTSRQTSATLHSLFTVAQDSDRLLSMDPAAKTQLSSVIKQVAESISLSQTVQAVAALRDVSLSTVESNLGFVLSSSAPELQDMDIVEDSKDLSTDPFANKLAQLPSISSTVPNCLVSQRFDTFDTLAAVAVQAATTEDMEMLFHTPVLRRSKKLEQPTFYSFAVSLLSGPYSITIRTLVLEAMARSIDEIGCTTDLQHLLPYVLYSLMDPNQKVRKSAVECVLSMARISKASDEEVGVLPRLDTWDVSGRQPDLGRILDTKSYHKVLSKLVTPFLEEFVLDSTSLQQVFVVALNGKSVAQSSEKSNKLKKDLRETLFEYLADFAVNTSALAVRVRILLLLADVGKQGSTTRSSLLLPAVKGWIEASSLFENTVSRSSQLTAATVLDSYLSAVTSRERFGLDLLIGLTNPSSHTDHAEQTIQACFRRIRTLWPSIKSEYQVKIATTILAQTIERSSDTLFNLRQRESGVALMSLEMSSSVLKAFLTSLPDASSLSDDSQPSKRRRTDDGHVSPVTSGSRPTVTNHLRKITTVLEVIENSGPENHPILLGGLFNLLHELQVYKTQTGSDMVYLQNSILDSLLAIINGLKKEPAREFDRSSIRTEVLVDCVRTTSKSQVQNTALLLISRLATLVPDIVLHSVMPIFTHMSTTLLRQGDDYSAHVISETISRVTPPLVESLRKRHQDLVTGAAEILYSFVSAFEHIPVQRRIGLFSHFCNTLGPQDSLFAVVAMLVDKHPTDNRIRSFVVELMREFDAVTQLKTAVRVLHLLQDLLEPRRSLSEVVFNLKETDADGVEKLMYRLLETVASFLHDQNLRLRLLQTLESDESDSAVCRVLLGQLFQSCIKLSKAEAEDQDLRIACGNILDRLLNLLPTVELILTADDLLPSPDVNVRQHVLTSVSTRVRQLKQMDDLSRTTILGFIPKVSALIKPNSEAAIIQSAITCIDRVAERIGAKDSAAMLESAQSVLGVQNFTPVEDRLLTSSLFCLASIIDATKADFVPLVPDTIRYTFECLSKSITTGSEDLHDGAYVVLSAILENVAFSVSGRNLDEALQQCHRSASQLSGEDVVQSRLHFYQLIVGKIEHKSLFTSLARQWLHAAQASYEALYEHIRILGIALDRCAKSSAVKQAESIFGLLQQAFDTRRQRNDSNLQISLDDEQLVEFEGLTNDVALAFTMKLNDTVFRPLFSRLVDWASSSLPKQDVEDRASRCVSLFSFLGAFSDRLKGLSTSYFSHTLELAGAILRGGFSDAKVNDLLLEAVLKALRQGFEHDQDDFWQAPAHFDIVSEPLVARLSCSPGSQIASYVIPAIASLCSATSSVEQHKAIDSAILKLMRSEHAGVRVNAVMCQQSITERLGDDWLGLLPEMLPFISELQEDDDEEVERETQRWIRMIEETLGESLDEMLQ